MNDTQGFSEFHERRLSNGAKAAQIAAQHFGELEQENEKLRVTIEGLRRDLSVALAQRENEEMRANRAEQERNEWQAKAMGLATSIGTTVNLFLDVGQEAREIVNTLTPPRVEEREQ